MEEGWESCRKDGDAKRRRECLYVDNEGKEAKTMEEKSMERIVNA